MKKPDPLSPRRLGCSFHCQRESVVEVVSGLEKQKADLQGPHEAYRQRVTDHRNGLADLERKESLLGNARIVIFLAGCLAAWMAFGADWFSAWWLTVAIAAFLMVLPLHD